MASLRLDHEGREPHPSFFVDPRFLGSKLLGAMARGNLVCKRLRSRPLCTVRIFDFVAPSTTFRTDAATWLL